MVYAARVHGGPVRERFLSQGDAPEGLKTYQELSRVNGGAGLSTRAVRRGRSLLPVLSEKRAVDPRRRRLMPATSGTDVSLQGWGAFLSKDYDEVRFVLRNSWCSLFLATGFRSFACLTRALERDGCDNCATSV
ncbi:hypothetical protein TRVL_02717 [Trypanosoma vivax]|nr:hypothetical protein TRVL_02717 [Trypanosoma vivax]